MSIRTLQDRAPVEGGIDCAFDTSPDKMDLLSDRGEPAFALLNVDEYRRIVGGTRNLVELIALPEADELELDIDPIRIAARDVDG